MLGVHPLRMPLDANSKRMPLQLDAFNHVIGRPCRSNQTPPQSANRLMVRAVGANLLRLKDVGEERPALDPHLVGQDSLILEMSTRVLLSSRKLGWEVLPEGASQGYVQNLMAPANGQHR